MTCQIDMMPTVSLLLLTQIWERATNKQLLLSYNAATLPQPRSQQKHKATPWAWGGISAVYRSWQSVTEDSQSWGCGRIYPDYTASIITNRHEKKSYRYNNLLSAQCSLSCCAGSGEQFSSNYACLLSPFANLCARPSPRSVSDVRAALTGLFLVCKLPIPF